mgnify:CR=1 FL=1
MKRLAKVIISGIDHMVNFIVLMLILLLMFLSCYMLWDSNQVFEAADAKNYEAYMPSENHTKSFEELQKINPDVFGWIRINDTNVNYPLLQAEDDDTYEYGCRRKLFLKRFDFFTLCQCTGFFRF